MKISLRKANALQTAISEALAGLDFATEVAINEFEKPTAKIAEKQDSFFKNEQRRAALLDAQYQIRENVKQENSSNGIDDRLVKVARLEKDVSFYSRFMKMEPALDNDVIVGKLGKLKGQAEAYYGREEAVRTTIFTTEVIVDFKGKVSSLKKNKQALQDELLELNVRNEIELTANTVAVLKAENIL